MSPSVFRQVASLLDGRDEFGEGRLDEGAVGVIGMGPQVTPMDGDAW